MLPFATSYDEPSDRAEVSPSALTAEQKDRLTTMVRSHLDFVWRSLRRQGLPPAVADDATQQVFVVASRRIGSIDVGAERSFLFQTALRVGSDARRAWARRRETLDGEAHLGNVRDSALSPEEEAHRRRSLALLEEVLGSLDEKLRAPFVLFEMEGLEIKEIAEVLGIPVGTVGSRLRAARDEFLAAAKRIRARQGIQEKDR
jgi:RNA polymerase sigma-70 factor (ECF subfamily)